MTSEEDRKEIRFVTIAASLALLGFVELITQSNPRTLYKIHRALGPMPYGVPVEIFIPLFVGLLWLPVPYFVYNAVIVSRFAAPQKRFRPGLAGVVARIRYLGETTGEELPVRRAKRVCLFSGLYGLGVAVWWTYWTSVHF
jgi:hypothetical protein